MPRWPRLSCACPFGGPAGVRLCRVPLTSRFCRVSTLLVSFGASHLEPCPLRDAAMLGELSVLTQLPQPVQLHLGVLLSTVELRIDHSVPCGGVDEILLLDFAAFTSLCCNGMNSVKPVSGLAVSMVSAEYDLIYLQRETEEKARQPEIKLGATAQTHHKAKLCNAKQSRTRNPKPTHGARDRPKQPQPRAGRDRASESGQRHASQRTRPTDTGTRCPGKGQRYAPKAPPR
jgi:hypothetical protein